MSSYKDKNVSVGYYKGNLSVTSSGSVTVTAEMPGMSPDDILDRNLKPFPVSSTIESAWNDVNKYTKDIDELKKELNNLLNELEILAKKVDESKEGQKEELTKELTAKGGEYENKLATLKRVKVQLGVTQVQLRKEITDLVEIMKTHNVPVTSPGWFYADIGIVYVKSPNGETKHF